MRNINGTTYAILAIALLGLATPAFAENPQDSAHVAKKLLDDAAAYLSSQDNIAIQAKIVYEGVYQDQSEDLITQYFVAFKRPGEISVRAQNSQIEVHFFSDGNRYTRYIPEYNQYIKEDDTPSPSNIIKNSGFDLITPALSVMSELTLARPFSDESPLNDITYMGQEDVNGIDCARVHFTYEDFGCDLWIDSGDKPLVRRIQPNMSAMEAAYEDRTGLKFSIKVAADITRWEIGADIEDRLAFNAPEDSEEVETFEPPRERFPAEDMIGKKAPDFTLELLDGGELTLSEKRGKEVVILDFWATWCGPCRIAMPVLEEISAEFAEKGVRLYSVNQGESPSTIKPYLEGKGLDVAVALDQKGEVSVAYFANAIPQTVIIDLEGNVAVVHVGLWAMPKENPGPETTDEEYMQSIHDALANALREELEALTK